MNLALIRRKRRKERIKKNGIEKERNDEKKEYFYRKVDWTLAGLLKSKKIC